MDILTWLYELSKAFFGASATAVTEYPLTTLLVFIGIFYFLHQKSWLILYDSDRGTFKLPSFPGEIIVALAGFIGAVILSHVVGYLFFIMAKVIEWILSGVGLLFNTTIELTSPFSTDPLTYIILLVLVSALGFLYVFWKSAWKVRGIDPIRALVTGFVVLFVTYVSTSIYIAVSETEVPIRERAITAPQ